MTRTSGSEINYLDIFVHPSSVRCTKQIQTMCLCVIGQKRLNEDRTKTSAHVMANTRNWINVTHGHHSSEYRDKLLAEPPKGTNGTECHQEVCEF